MVSASCTWLNCLSLPVIKFRKAEACLLLSRWRLVQACGNWVIPVVVQACDTVPHESCTVAVITPAVGCNCCNLGAWLGA